MEMAILFWPCPRALAPRLEKMGIDAAYVSLSPMPLPLRRDGGDNSTKTPTRTMIWHTEKRAHRVSQRSRWVFPRGVQGLDPNG